MYGLLMCYMSIWDLDFKNNGTADSELQVLVFPPLQQLVIATVRFPRTSY